MMNGVLHGQLSYQPNEVFKSVAMPTETPLYSRCTKYSKVSTMFSLFLVKMVGDLNNMSFTMFVELLAYTFLSGNDIPKSIFYVKKVFVL